MSESYCSRCKRKTPDHDVHYEMSASGRKMLKSHCSCGAKKSSFAKGSLSALPKKAPMKARVPKVPKVGDGLFSFIPGIGSTLNDIGNTAIGIGKSVAVPLATRAISARLGGSVRPRNTLY